MGQAAPWIASAIPAVVSALSPKPQAPNMPDFSAANAILMSPDAQKVRAQLLEMAGNPNNQIFQMAGQQAMRAASNRAASRGLGSSSLLDTTMNDIYSNLARDEYNRKIALFNAATGQAGQMAGQLSNNVMNGYNAANGMYQNQMQGASDFGKGLGSMFGGATNAYLYQQYLDKMSPQTVYMPPQSQPSSGFNLGMNWGNP